MTTAGVSTGTGSILVSSKPSGSSVNLDGWDKGTIPVNIPDVSGGTPRLLLLLQNYDDISRTVEVTGGTDTEVSIEFPVENETPGFSMALSLAVVAIIAPVMLGKKKDH